MYCLHNDMHPQPLKDVDIKYTGFDTKLVNLPNDWFVIRRLASTVISVD